MSKGKTCCFIGHKTIEESEELKKRVYDIIENLIVNENVDTFYYGSKSNFNRLCKDLLCQLKEKYSHITRIYIRAEYPYIDDDYKDYLLYQRLLSCRRIFRPARNPGGQRAGKLYCRRSA